MIPVPKGFKHDELGLIKDLLRGLVVKWKEAQLW